MKYEKFLDLKGLSKFAFTLTVFISVDCPVTYEPKRYFSTPQNENFPQKKVLPPLKILKFVEKTFFTEKNLIVQKIKNF